MILVNPCYFGPISIYSSILKNKNFIFEVCDNYQKQTYRNRCCIASANGKLVLNVPIKHSWKNQKPSIKNVQIDNSEKWQKQHLRSIENAYSSSPFFEFYIDDLRYIFETKFDSLIELNLACHKTIMSLLDVQRETIVSEKYEENPKNDKRHLVLAKEKNHINLPMYIQVFEQKNGFISNLSILDLIFMEGPSAAIYLEKCTISNL